MPVHPELMKVFNEEARELISRIRRDLDAASREATITDPDSRLKELFRWAHTLKGSSATVDYMDLKRLADAMTEAFRAARGGLIRLGAKEWQLLSRAVDACEVLLKKDKVTEYKKLVNKIRGLYAHNSNH